MSKQQLRKPSRLKRLRPLAGLLALGITAPAFADKSDPFPTYETGPLPNGGYVVGNGQIVTPAGIQVDLGDRVRAKAIALNPVTATHTAAVLTLGATEAVEVFDTRTGQVLQNYLPFGDSSGSYSGISYTADGKYLVFSQDSSNVAVAQVLPQGLLADYAHVAVPPNNSFITCFPNSPMGDYGRSCGTFYSTNTSYPGGLAVTADGKSAYALLNQNDTITQIDLTQNPPVQGAQIRVGNAPHSVVIAGSTAYVSNEGGRAAVESDFQIYSAGTPIVANKVNGSAITGTVSVVDLPSMTVTASIPVGLHPTGMAMFGSALLVCNTYSDTISVIDTATNRVMRTIDLSLPIKVPGQSKPAYGAGPNAIAVDASAGVAYVALYNANAIAVVDLSGSAQQPVMGMIPVAYAPASVVLDSTDGVLLVANDKGIGTRNSFETDYGVTGYNTHQDNGTVSIVPIPSQTTLASMTKTVHQNNHWDLGMNIRAAGNGSPGTPPVALPLRIGDPSLIKHVFLIIRENRTYDQILGDVAAGNGDPGLAVFGGRFTPNLHAIVQRFPLLDNFYAPSRQSADGHQWIVEAMAPYADDIQSPDWVRSYPGGNAGDALAYQKKGFLFQESVAAGLSTKIYGEYVENEFFPTKQGHPTWSQYYADSQKFEAGKEPVLHYQNSILVESSIPVVSDHLIKNFPQFDLNIPDQYRVDLWLEDFQADLKADTVPALTILWIMCDHTGGPPTAGAQQADNDLAVGRIIEAVSKSKVWGKSAIFIEEDDAQNGVDHVDGHRSPAYVVSPYALQGGPADHTYYTQVNITRTIEQILGLPPMNQFDLVASPMSTAFVVGTPPDANFAPFTHLPNQVPLDQGVNANTYPQGAMAKAWRAAKVKIYAGKSNKPDSEDQDTVNHLNWYEATDFKRPYPGERYVRPPTEFKDRLGHPAADLDD
jgi:YVTN family beta-propeller protein